MVASALCEQNLDKAERKRKRMPEYLGVREFVNLVVEAGDVLLELRNRRFELTLTRFRLHPHRLLPVKLRADAILYHCQVSIHPFWRRTNT